MKVAASAGTNQSPPPVAGLQWRPIGTFNNLSLILGPPVMAPFWLIPFSTRCPRGDPPLRGVMQPRGVHPLGTSPTSAHGLIAFLIGGRVCSEGWAGLFCHAPRRRPARLSPASRTPCRMTAAGAAAQRLRAQERPAELGTERLGSHRDNSSGSIRRGRDRAPPAAERVGSRSMAS